MKNKTICRDEFGPGGIELGDPNSRSKPLTMDFRQLYFNLQVSGFERRPAPGSCRDY